MAGPNGSANDVKAKALELANRFSATQKMMMGGVTVAVVIAMVLIMKSASATEMTSLYSNLQPADAASVTEKLTAEGTAYQLADGGATIMVPKEKVYDLRLSMAAEGLPQQGPEGYALLDKQGITASEFSQQVGYQRALEGELTKTIGAMDPIASSTVHLAIPKDDVFASDKGKASASVLVKTKPGKTLDTTQVQAIVHLVASSVQNLAPEAVTVADATGQVLAAPGTENGDTAANDLNSKQRAGYEKNMSTSIQALLEPVVGAGKSKVTVSADLDFDQKKATSETFENPTGDPNRNTVSSESVKRENYAGPGTNGEAGVLGPDGAPVNNGANGAAAYTNEQNETKYLQNRVVEETKSAPGTVRRMSVAVLVDEGVTTAAQVQQIQNLVSAAAGVNPARGDDVQVSRMAFGGSEALRAAQQKELDDARAAESQAATMGMIRQAAVVLFLVGLIFFVYRSLRKAARRKAPGLYAGEVREITAPAQMAEPLALDAPAVPGTIELAEPVVAEEAPAPRPRLVTREVEDMIDQQPTEVAQMLRSWLGEGKKVRK